MVDFNKTPNPSNDPSYMGYSQGTDRPTPNRVFGSLFEGIGATVANEVNQKDKDNLKAISDELYAGVDAIRGAQGVDTAVQNDGIIHQTNRETPEAVTSATGQINRLTEAFQAGKISDTSYWAKVESLTKGVRAKYPGYREEIDKTVAGITGSIPANALRRSVLEDLQKAEAKAESSVNKWDTWERSNLEWIALVAPDYFVKKNQGTPYSKDYILNAVAQKQASVKAIENGNKELSYAESVGKLTENQASSAATNAAETFVWNALDTAKKITLSNGMTFTDAIDQSISTGKPLSPELHQEILGQLNNLEAQVNMGVSKVFSQKDQQTGKSYSEFMRGDVTKLGNIKQNAMAPIQALKQALATGDLATAKYYSNITTSMTNQKTADILGRSPTIQTIAGLANIQGAQNVIPMLISASNPKFLDQAMKDVVDINTVRTVTGDQNVDSAIAAVNKQTNGNPGANKAVLDNVTNLLNDPKTTGQAFAQLAKSTFTSNFLQQLQSNNPDTVINVYKKMISPAVQRKMEELKGSNPEVYKAYSQWAVQNAGSLFRKEFSDLQQGVESVPYLEVHFDQKNSQFTYKVNEQGQKLLNQPALGFGSIVSNQIGTTIKSIKTVNDLLQTVTPILKTNGQEVPAALDTLFRDMGVNPNAKKQSSIVGKMHRALGSALSAFQRNVEGPPQTEDGGQKVESVFQAGVTGFGTPDPTTTQYPPGFFGR